MVIESGYWVVSHQKFATDTLIRTTTVVKAQTKEEALEKYNKQAKEYMKYPYMWSVAILEEVYPLEIVE